VIKKLLFIVPSTLPFHGISSLYVRQPSIWLSQILTWNYIMVLAGLVLAIDIFSCYLHGWLHEHLSSTSSYEFKSATIF